MINKIVSFSGALALAASLSVSAQAELDSPIGSDKPVEVAAVKPAKAEPAPANLAGATAPDGLRVTKEAAKAAARTSSALAAGVSQQRPFNAPHW